MKNNIFIALAILFLESCCGKFDESFSSFNSHSAYTAKDSLESKIKLNENDTILYRNLFLVWKPDIYYFSDTKNWNILNEILPTAYACKAPSPTPIDSIQNINIKSLGDWNSSYKADSSLNSIFKFLKPYSSNTYLSLTEIKNQAIKSEFYFNPIIAPDSTRKHIFIIDLSLKNGKQYIDTLNPVWVKAN